MSKGGTKESNLPRRYTRRGANDTEQSELEPILLNDEDEKRSNASSSSVHSMDATLDFMKQMMMEMQRKKKRTGKNEKGPERRYRKCKNGVRNYYEQNGRNGRGTRRTVEIESKESWKKGECSTNEIC